MAKEDELGAMWIKSGQRGEYMTGKVKVFSPETGKLEDISIVMFRNDKKKNPKEPDWRILKSKQQDGQPRPSTRPHQQAAGIEESDPFA